MAYATHYTPTLGYSCTATAWFPQEIAAPSPMKELEKQNWRKWLTAMARVAQERVAQRRAKVNAMQFLGREVI